MKMKQIIALIIAIAATASFGAAAIRVDGVEYVSKEAVMRVSEKVYAARSQGPVRLTAQDEREIIDDVILDFKFWTITKLEYTRRNLSIADVESQSSRLAEMKNRAKYFDKFNMLLFNTDCLMLACAANLLRMDGIPLPASRTGIRDTFLSRYSGNYSVDVAKHSKWRIKYGLGVLIQDSDYDAIENELDEDSGIIRKAIYYAHHYTVRYYVIFIRWYIDKATAFSSYVKEKTSKEVAQWVRIAVLYIIPYLFHVLVLAIYKKANDQRVRFFRLLFPALLFSGVSTILFYFGMSPWSLFVVCVGVPLGLYMAPSILDSMSGGGSSYSGGGSSYTSGGGASSSSGGDEVSYTTTITDENGCEYKGEGKDPETIEKQTPGDHAIFDRRMDGSYKERFGDRVLEK